jgi:ribosomal protein S18 acetylase RimI-like enzyme
VQVTALGREDLDEIVAVHLEAFPTSAMTRLGASAVRAYYDWLLTGPHDVVAVGALAPSGLAGFVIGGTFHGAMSGYLRANSALLARSLLVRPGALASDEVRDRLRFALRVRARRPGSRQQSGPLPKASVSAAGNGRMQSFTLLAMAVRPWFQGSGVATSLMEGTVDAAAAAGYDSMRLSVRAENARAIAFYEREGWHRSATTPTSLTMQRAMHPTNANVSVGGQA